MCKCLNISFYLIKKIKTGKVSGSGKVFDIFSPSLNICCGNDLSPLTFTKKKESKYCPLMSEIIVWITKQKERF